MRILVVEDDPTLGDALCFALKLSNYAVDRVANGTAADQALRDGCFDLLILDLGLPKLDGFEVLKRLRHRNATLPVLILSGRDDPDEKARGLDLGADDYLVKPFSLNELQARVRALLRRGQCGSATQQFKAGVCFDTITRTALVDGRAIELSAKEVSIFEVLFSHYGRAVSKQQLLERLYSYDDSASFNAIEVYVHRLRKKLEGSGMTVRTLHGRGYQLDHQEH
ncbi:MAG: response regulator transcription factor [Betaproteobacteria bacterium]|nr:response regulator transcription factor [Betaproteobacteria bacterium]